MRGRRALIVLGLAALVTLAVLMRQQLRGKSYASFVSHDHSYYTEVAHACDSVLKAHPGITNRFLQLAGSDPSLPGPILQLHATEVRVYPNRLWIGFEAERESFAVLWEAQPEAPRSWRLMTDFQGVLNPVYIEQKP